MFAMADVEIGSFVTAAKLGVVGSRCLSNGSTQIIQINGVKSIGFILK